MLQLKNDVYDKALAGFEKTISELVKRGEEKQKRLKEKYETLKVEFAQSENDILELNRCIIDAEIDKLPVDSLKKKLEAAQQKRTNISDSLKAVEKSLESPVFSDGEIKKFKSMCKSLSDIREGNFNKINSRREEITNQIKQLNDELKSYSNDNNMFDYLASVESGAARGVVKYMFDKDDPMSEAHAGIYADNYRLWLKQ